MNADLPTLDPRVMTEVARMRGYAGGTALDLFAGPGGWSQACRRLGIDETGVELDGDACATARAAGHRRIRADVRDYVPTAPFDGLIASPPCQTFSQAGKGHGRDLLAALVVAVGLVARGATPDDALIDHGLWDDQPVRDERTTLVLEPLRFIRDHRPTWVALEQVPAVGPIWQAYAWELTRWGYSVAAGTASAEQYGVPQTRRRAILLAHRDRAVHWPPPTHSMYYARQPSRLDPGVLPWVSMADALGWDVDTLVGFARQADERGDVVTLDGVDYRARDLRPADRPAATVTEKSRSVVRVRDQSGTVRDAAWPTRRPSTTVAGRDLIADPGENANRDRPVTKSRNDGVRVTAAEAGVLQGFPADYPWRGTKTAQHRQIGDAIPPDLAQAILGALVDDAERVCTECGDTLATEGYAMCTDCLEATS